MQTYEQRMEEIDKQRLAMLEHNLALLTPAQTAILSAIQGLMDHNPNVDKLSAFTQAVHAMDIILYSDLKYRPDDATIKALADSGLGVAAIPELIQQLEATIAKLKTVA